jgi:hypothetical protein
LQEFQALDHYPIIHRNKKIPKISRKEEGKERDLSQSGTETSSMLLQYTTYYNTQKALQSIELPKKPAALSHTNSFAVAANAQCNNTTTTKSRAACEANPFSSRSGQEVPPATAAADKQTKGTLNNNNNRPSTRRAR